MGKVDCTTEDGKTLCQQYEIKGYPSLLFFPPAEVPEEGAKTAEVKAAESQGEQGEADDVEPAKFYKFQGPRSLPHLEEFAVKGGYKTSGESLEIPKNL